MITVLEFSEKKKKQKPHVKERKKETMMKREKGQRIEDIIRESVINPPEKKINK